MTMLRNTIVEAALLTMVVLAGAMVVNSAVLGEAAGCADKTCKMINYYHFCSGGAGVDKDKTCLYCSVGRCDSGANQTCDPTDILRMFATTKVTDTCDCAKTKGTVVEGTGNYTGEYGNSVVKRYKCPGSS